MTIPGREGHRTLEGQAVRKSSRERIYNWIGLRSQTDETLKINVDQVDNTDRRFLALLDRLSCFF